jgi:CRP/FNR family transcriptional regulator, dissimilatory nitrate respiration regulator
LRIARRNQTLPNRPQRCWARRPLLHTAVGSFIPRFGDDMTATTPSPEAFIANLPLFKELSQEQRARIAAGARMLRLARGETLFHRGDPAAGTYIVCYGRIKLSFVSPTGVEKVIEIIEQGQSFGEAVMFLDLPHVVGAQALADSLLLLVPKETVFENIDRDPAFARRMLAGLSRRLHQLVADVEAYSTRSGTERLIGFLLRDCIGSAAEDGAPELQGSIDIELPVAKGVIASRLNLTQEHLSRILHDLSALGLIEVHGRRIHVRDVERLRRHAR